MRVFATAILVLAFMASGAGATFTVYQGNSDHALGTFATLHQARVFARQHPGLGESIVNDTTGKTVKEPGRVFNGQAGTRNNLKHEN